MVQWYILALNYFNHNVVDKLMFGENVVKVLHDLAKLEHLFSAHLNAKF